MKKETNIKTKTIMVRRTEKTRNITWRNILDQDKEKKYASKRQTLKDFKKIIKKTQYDIIYQRSFFPFLDMLD